MTKTKRLIVKYGTEQACYDFGFYHQTLNSVKSKWNHAYCMLLSEINLIYIHQIQIQRLT